MGMCPTQMMSAISGGLPFRILEQTGVCVPLGREQSEQVFFFFFPRQEKGCCSMTIAKQRAKGELGKIFVQI